MFFYSQRNSEKKKNLFGSELCGTTDLNAGRVN